MTSSEMPTGSSVIEPNPQLIRHLEKAADQWSKYVNFNTSTAVKN